MERLIKLESFADKQKLVGIISCTDKKLPGWHKARELYTSNYFVICRNWAERNFSNWYVLSAKYGIVHSRTRISGDNYDIKLSDLTGKALEDWLTLVKYQLGGIRQHMPGVRFICALSPKYYGAIKGPDTFDIFASLKGQALGVAGRSKLLTLRADLTEDILYQIVKENNMTEPSRYIEGGFEPRFVVTRTDGKPCRPDARYIVLDGSGADPHAVKALREYANSVRSENQNLADDLEYMLDGNWPAELAQHKDAK